MVLRDGTDGSTEVLVVYRNKYEDWSLPKGKVDKGESGKEAALREVLEETGVRCELGERLPDVHYTVDGRPKRVKFWSMTVLEDLGGPVDQNEVEKVCWAAAPDFVELGLRQSDLDTVTAALALR